MAIRIFEFSAPIFTLRPSEFLAKQAGTVAASSDQSETFQGATRCVTVQSDEACHIAFGDDPTATTADFKVAAGETWDFAVEGGDKVAWIQA
jgi:hypothetical protein